MLNGRDMAKKCDNKSVAILVRNGDKILLIERKAYNPGFALPAGHQDGDDEITTAKKELGEEVGLAATKLIEKVKLRLNNPCKREGGTHHDWTVFEAESWSGVIKPSDEEVKTYVWTDRQQVSGLAEKLEDFVESLGLVLSDENMPKIVEATNSDDAWKRNPGLEPAMHPLFKTLKII